MSSRNDLVIYLISGPAHIPYLTVSIWSLRKSGYTGPVTVFAWPESVGFMRDLERDDRLNIWVSEREPQYRKQDGLGGNSQGLDRIALAQSLDCDVSLYIDADSSIHGDIRPIFDVADNYGYCATQWCDWVTNHGHTYSRVRELLGVGGIPKELVDEVITHRWPSLNCGVFASKPSSPLLPQWHEWCKMCGSMFISDEKTQHLLMSAFPNQIGVWMGGAFNCSPKFQPAGLVDKDVVIYHYHGDSNVRPQKSPRGWEIWHPMWTEVLIQNIGGIAQHWHLMGNKWLPKLIKSGEMEAYA